MRLKCTVLLALLVASPLASLAAAAPGAGTAESEPLRILEDAANDLSAQELLTAPVPRGSMDLRYLDITETLDTLLLKVGTEPDPGLTDQGQINIWFRHEDSVFRLNLQQRNLMSGWWWVYSLAREEPESGTFSYVAGSVPSEPLASSRTEGWVEVEIEKSFLADRAGAVPFVGRTLDDIWVQSFGYLLDPQLRDRMPDSGMAREPFEFLVGPEQTGDIELWSTSPSRASNGEATTFIFEVQARNTGRTELNLRFAGEEVPEGWNVGFPNPVVRLGAGETQTYPVLVRMPFRHTHGEVAAVNITLSDGDNVGRTSLSVLYHAIPQPAGHHDTLYLHSDQSPDALTPAIHASGVSVWHRITMNAKADFDGDDRVAVPASNADGAHQWGIWLDPVLMMGLDFDLARVGELNVPIQAATPIAGAALAGELYVTWPAAAGGWEFLQVATLEGEPAKDLEAGRETMFQASVLPTPDSDLVPYREGANMALLLRLERSDESLGVGAQKPEILPGAFMTLPLNEYHDPVDEVFRTLQGVSLDAVGPRQRAVNPGETVTFTLDLGYDGAASSFALRLEGQDARHARIIGDDVVRAGGGTRASFTVAVTAPPTAAPGTFLDLVVVAQKRADADVQGLLRLVADVDDSVDHPDETMEAEAMEAPGLALGALAAMLVGLAAGRRRGTGRS